MQALQANGFQVARHLVVQPRRRRRLLGDHLLQGFRRRRGPERRPARQQLVQDRPQRVHVRRRPGRVPLPLGLLGSHVARRAHRDPAQGQGAPALQAPGQAEIRHLRRAVRGEQDVGRLEIAVHDAALVRRVDGVGQGRHQRRRLANRLRNPLDLLSQAAALDQLHREVRPAVHLAHVVELDHVRVAQSSHRFRLAQETLPLVRPGIGAGQQHLQGDGPVEAQVPRFVDDPRPAAPQHALHFVERDPR